MDFRGGTTPGTIDRRMNRNVTLRRFDHVGITVADLDAVTALFVALGLEAGNRMFVEGEFLDTVFGIPGSRTEVVMLQPPDGGTRLELSSFVRPDHLPGYLQGIDNAEIIATVHARKTPMVPASTGLRLEWPAHAGVTVANPHCSRRRPALLGGLLTRGTRTLAGWPHGIDRSRASVPTGVHFRANAEPPSAMGTYAVRGEAYYASSAVPASRSAPPELFSIARVFDSIWRTRSRVTPTSWPMSSRVIGPLSPRP
jgi:hypothetical protein